jgi:hypothetical protein
MSFDQVFAALCRYMESCPPEEVGASAIRRAPVFELPGPDEERLAAVAEHPAAFKDSPPPYDDFVMLMAPSKAESGVWVSAYVNCGLTCIRNPWLLRDMTDMVATWRRPAAIFQAIWDERMPKFYGVKIGFVDLYAADNGGFPMAPFFTVAGDVGEGWKCSTFDMRPGDGRAEELAAMARAIVIAIAYIDLPRHHCIMETPGCAEKAAERAERSGKIPRLHDRARIRLIKPEEVRKVYPRLSEPGSTGKTVAPHQRRGFVRTLRSEKWGEKRGSTLYVRPTWVGPEQWEDSGTRYRVVQPERAGAP